MSEQPNLSDSSTFRKGILTAVKALKGTKPASAKAAGALRSRIEVLEEMLANPWDESSEQGKGLIAIRLRGARLAAGLTQEQAACRAGISLAAYRNCERGYRYTSETILTKIAKVAELGLSSPLGNEGTAALSEQAPSWWVDARFEPLQMLQDLRYTLNGGGGHVEQSLMYLDHQSAADFLNLSGGSRYARRYRERVPLERVVEAIIANTGTESIDIIGLGSGDGRHEVALTELMADSFERPDLKLTLLDVSQPLLNVAYRHAAETFEKRRGVAIFALQGNFHHLPAFTQIHYRPSFSRRRKVITMLGSTFSNLADEIHFFRHSLSPFAGGDLAVLDFNEAAPRPWDVNDPVLSRPVPQSHQDFLGGPIWRYCREVISVSFKYELGPNIIVPDSYAIEANATVKTKDGDKRFTMFRFKRYDAGQLVASLKGVGWELAGAYPYGSKVDERAQIIVLRKK